MLTANYDYTCGLAFVRWCQPQVYLFFLSHWKDNYEYCCELNALHQPSGVCIKPQQLILLF